MPRPSIETTRGWRDKTMVDHEAPRWATSLTSTWKRSPGSPSGPWLPPGSSGSSCRWSTPPNSRTRPASPSSGRWSPTAQSSGPVGSCPRRPPPGCTATTAAPRAALGKCQADAEGWASRSPPAACCWPGAVGESGRPAWPALLVGPSDRYLPCPPGRCVGGGAGGTDPDAATENAEEQETRMAGNLKLLAGLGAGYVLGPGLAANATSGLPRPPAGWPRSGPRSASSSAPSGPTPGPAWRRPPTLPAIGSSRPEAMTPPRGPGPGRGRRASVHPAAGTGDRPGTTGRGRPGSWRGPRRDRVATVPGRRGGGERPGR